VLLPVSMFCSHRLCPLPARCELTMNFPSGEIAVATAVPVFVTCVMV
jgi:hypothetical protein